MGAVTVREVLWAVSGMLNDSAPQFARWPEGQLVPLLDDAQMAIAKYLPAATSRTDAFLLEAGSKQQIDSVPGERLTLEGDASLPDPTFGIEFLGGVRNLGKTINSLIPGRAITPIDRSLLDDLDPDWHTKSGLPIRHVMVDPRLPRTFYVYPPNPIDVSTWIEIQWVVQPRKIPNTGAPGSELYAWAGSSTLGLTVADEHKDDLINYVVARAYMTNSQSTANQAMADRFAQLFLGSLNAKVQVVVGNSPNLKRLPMAPANIGTAS